MYKGHSIWDEERDKYGNIVPDREENKAEYRNQEDYTSKGGEASDVYNTEKAEGEKKEKEEAKGIEKDLMGEERKYEKKEDVSEEDIKQKAASEVHEGVKSEGNNSKKKKAHKSIEDAINKAMKEEKEVIYIDDD